MTVLKIRRWVFIQFIRNFFIPFNIIVKVKNKRKFNSVINFLSLHCKVIESKPLKDDVKEGRHFNKSGSSLSFCFLSAITAVIQIVFIQNLWFEVPLQSKLQFMIVDFLVYIFDGYDEILEILLSCGLIETLMTFCVMNEFAFKVIFDKVLMNVVLAFGGEGFFECLEKQSVKLLDVLLHLSLFIFPLEAFDELLGWQLIGETSL